MLSQGLRATWGKHPPVGGNRDILQGADLLGKGLGRVSAVRSSFVGLPTKPSFCRAAGKGFHRGVLQPLRVSASRQQLLVPFCRAAGKWPKPLGVEHKTFNGHPWARPPRHGARPSEFPSRHRLLHDLSAPRRSEKRSAYTLPSPSLAHADLNAHI